MDFKKNGFLIGIVAGLVVAVIVVAVLVVPAWSAAGEEKDKVTNSYGNDLRAITTGPKVPTQQWVDSLNTHAQGVNEESKKLYNFFNASDMALERWFDDKEPAKGVLMSRATDGILQMLRDLRTAIGDANVPADGKAQYGEPKIFGFEFPLSAEVQDDPESKKKWMRVYNIHARMKEALIEAKAQRFYKVQFSKVAGPAEMTAKQMERPLTNDLGMTIPFVVEASFLWKDLPAFTNAIVRYDPAKPGPMFRIVMMNVERDLSPAFMPVAEIKEDVDAASYNEKTWKPTKEPLEPALRVNVLVEAYNFTFTQERLK